MLFRSREHVNVIGANTVTRDASAHMRLTVEIASIAELNRVLALVRDVAGVTRAVRR